MGQSRHNEPGHGWTFADIFDELSAVLGTRPALIHGPVVRSWEEFGSRSNNLARSLVARGLGTGDKVAFMLRNGPAYLELFAACTKARLIHVNVNYRYVERELRYVLTAFDVRCVVFDAEFAAEVELLRPQLDPEMLYVQVPVQGVASPTGEWAGRVWTISPNLGIGAADERLFPRAGK